MVGPDNNLEKGPHEIKEEKNMNDKHLKRIADALEEILRLVKKDLKTMKEAAQPEKRPTIQ